ncbi:MAG: dTDP-4-dehydrorhamnose 3,5-epimerase [Armatimonadetes bacterium]|nr:dTDP-4-dehydrorhamnose 3,5-epimerase [Candidatus Hippobium faecium]
MIITETELKDALIIEPKIHSDGRGWFMESYNSLRFREMGLIFDFVQDNRSYNSKAGVLRGLHCQKSPHSQTKLVTCLRGAVEDYIVDIRKNSPTYMKWISVTLTGENRKQLLVPKGFLHGFVVLESDSEFMYKVDDYYYPDCDRTIRFDDPIFGIDWKCNAPILSEKDTKAPMYKDRDFDF